jgi:aspartyl-tRNA(Asn)/glutamyl-tRNA(Gln) amidotransferase subunit A
MLDGLDAPVASAFQRALAALSGAGASIQEFSFPEINEIVQIIRTCGLSSVEAYEIHRKWLGTRGNGYDPRVLARLDSASEVDPKDYFDTLRLRAGLVERSRRITERFDAVLMPTVPVVAPLISQFIESEEARRKDYPILIRNTCVANYFDRCALTIPCHEPGSAPVGLTLMGEHMADHSLMGIGMSVEAVLAATIAVRNQAL